MLPPKMNAFDAISLWFSTYHSEYPGYGPDQERHVDTARRLKDACRRHEYPAPNNTTNDDGASVE